MMRAYAVNLYYTYSIMHLLLQVCLLRLPVFCIASGEERVSECVSGVQAGVPLSV